MIAGLAFQLADALKSCCVPSENIPVAMNCRLVPFGMDLFAGLILIWLSLGAPPLWLEAVELLPPQPNSSEQNASAQRTPMQASGWDLMVVAGSVRGEGVSYYFKNSWENTNLGIAIQLAICTKAPVLIHMN